MTEPAVRRLPAVLDEVRARADSGDIDALARAAGVLRSEAENLRAEAAALDADHAARRGEGDRDGG